MRLARRPGGEGAGKASATLTSARCCLCTCFADSMCHCKQKYHQVIKEGWGKPQYVTCRSYPLVIMTGHTTDCRGCMISLLVVIAFAVLLLNCSCYDLFCVSLNVTLGCLLLLIDHWSPHCLTCSYVPSTPFCFCLTICWLAGLHQSTHSLLLCA